MYNQNIIINLMSKIIDHLYLGSYEDIKNKFYISIDAKLIINVTKECKYDIDIPQIKMEYADNPNVDILENVDSVLDTIHQHISKHETVFVHCYMGKSRSVTIILAYLITHQNFTLKEAFDHVRTIRNINPNIGFIRKLIAYEYDKKFIITLDYHDAVIEYITQLLDLDKDYVKRIYSENNMDADRTIDVIFKPKKN
jgi:hypothetical protein